MSYDRVTAYARAVVSGAEPSGHLHYLACKRHLDDLEKQNTDEFPYYWDYSKAEEVLNYGESLTIAEGAAPRALELLDCQAFDIGCTFGWCKSKSGLRRFRRRYKSMSRQNGKVCQIGQNR